MVTHKTTLNEFLAEENAYELLQGGHFGLEIEQHRVTREGRLSRVPYPATLGSRATHPYLQTDYSETQSELVTEAVASFEEARWRLLELQWVMRHHMQPDETIWPLSMPPCLQDDDLAWLDETFDRPWVQDYRDWLMDKYGSTHEVITGLHVNYSLPEEILRGLFNRQGGDDFIAFKNDFYFKLAQQISAHRWLFIYLFGASPFNLNDTDMRIPQIDHPVRSVRTSQFGFANDANIHVDYCTTLDDHLAQIETHVSAGDLFSNHEYYGTVRFKGRNDSTTLRESGVDYLELRILDTDPFDPAGVSENALNIIHLLLMYFALNDHQYSYDELAHYQALANEVSLQDPTDKLPNIDEAKEIMAKVSKLADHFGMRFNDGFSLLAERILTPSKTPAAKLIEQAWTPEALQEWAINIGNKRADLFHVEQDKQFVKLFGSDSLAKTVLHAIELGIRVEQHRANELVLRLGEHRETLTAPADLKDLFPEVNLN